MDPIVVHHAAKSECKVSQNVYRRNDFKHGQVGDRREPMRVQVESCGTAPVGLSSVCQLPSYLEAESFANNSTASCTVVMNCAGKIMVEFFSTEISAIVCRVRS
jgi:hypothetical protein